MAKLLDLDEIKNSSNFKVIANASGPTLYLYSIASKLNANEFWRDVSNKILDENVYSLSEEKEDNDEEIDYSDSLEKLFSHENLKLKEKEDIDYSQPLGRLFSHENLKLKEKEDMDDYSMVMKNFFSEENEKKREQRKKKSNDEEIDYSDSLENMFLLSLQNEANQAENGNVEYDEKKLLITALLKLIQSLEDKKQQEKEKQSDDAKKKDYFHNEHEEEDEESEDESEDEAKSLEQKLNTEDKKEKKEEKVKPRIVKKNEKAQNAAELVNNAKECLNGNKEGLANPNSTKILKHSILYGLLQLYPELKKRLKGLEKNLDYLQGTYGSKLEKPTENEQGSSELWDARKKEIKRYRLLDRFEFLDYLEEYIKSTMAEIYYSPEYKKEKEDSPNKLLPEDVAIAVLAQLLREEGTKEKENSFAFAYEELKEMVKERNEIEESRGYGKYDKELDTETKNIALIRTFAIFLFTAKNSWINEPPPANGKSEIDGLLEQYAVNLSSLKEKELDPTKKKIYTKITEDWEIFKGILLKKGNKEQSGGTNKTPVPLENLKGKWEEILDIANSSYDSNKLPDKIKSFIAELRAPIQTSDGYDEKQITRFILKEKNAFDENQPARKLIAK